MADTRQMTLKAQFVGFLVAAAAFLACCVIMLRYGHEIEAPTLVYPLIAIWGVSALAWPWFLVRTIRGVLAGRRHGW